MGHGRTHALIPSRNVEGYKCHRTLKNTDSFLCIDGALTQLSPKIFICRASEISLDNWIFLGIHSLIPLFAQNLLSNQDSNSGMPGGQTGNTSKRWNALLHRSAGVAWLCPLFFSHATSFCPDKSENVALRLEPSFSSSSRPTVLCSGSRKKCPARRFPTFMVSRIASRNRDCFFVMTN